MMTAMMVRSSHVALNRPVVSHYQNRAPFAFQCLSPVYVCGIIHQRIIVNNCLLGKYLEIGNLDFSYVAHATTVLRAGPILIPPCFSRHVWNDTT